MSISLVSEALRKLLSDGNPVELKSPMDESNENTSLWLYHVVPDEYSRNNTPPVVEEAGNGKPRKLGVVPLGVNLQYLITPMKKDSSANHEELTRLLLAIHEHPNLFVRDISQGINDKLRLSFVAEPLEERMRIWDAFKSKPYRLSFALLLRSAKLQPRTVVEEYPVGSLSAQTQAVGV